jgi:hypothetical protein
MIDSPKQEARYILRRAVNRHGAILAAGHPWLYEFDRWQELVFALLTRITQLEEGEVREITEELADLDLIDVTALAKIPAITPDTRVKSDRARHILDLLLEHGFNEEEALRGLKTLREAAIALKSHFDGKIQRYLRHYGELMLKEMPDWFKFSQIDDANARSAFTYWLQNVTSMPLSLADENLRSYCEQHELDPEQLFAAADELDINLAFIDDLAVLEVASSREANTPEPMAAG